MKGSRLRILGGALQGRRVMVPTGARPTGARTREALFSIWASRLAGCDFLDLFAGSGAMGIEALSRGARRALFVETARGSLQALKHNCRLLSEEMPKGGAAMDWQILRRRLPAPLPASVGKFHLIFADPPYDFDAYGLLLESAKSWLRKDGEMVIEHSARRTLESATSPWALREQRTYGESALSFFGVEKGSESASVAD